MRAVQVQAAIVILMKFPRTISKEEEHKALETSTVYGNNCTHINKMQNQITEEAISYFVITLYYKSQIINFS